MTLRLILTGKARCGRPGMCKMPVSIYVQTDQKAFFLMTHYITAYTVTGTIFV